VRQELLESALRPAASEPPEDVGEVEQGRDAVLGAGAGQAVEDRGARSGLVGAAEEVVAAAEGDGPQLLFTKVVIQTQPSIVDECESAPAIGSGCRPWPWRGRRSAARLHVW
jgi:hypothetical protein